MKLLGGNLPNIPWQEKPANCKDHIWRYTENPVINWDIHPMSNSVFNSAVVPFGDEFRGVFRVDSRRRDMRIHAGKSKDGIHWEIDENPIRFDTSKLKNPEETGIFLQGYDPRVCFIEDRYYVTWCNAYHGPTIGLAYTFDFETFYQLENIFVPCNRNGVLFPKKIDNKFVVLSRPSDRGHTPFCDIFYSESPDLEYWGHHRWVAGPDGGWESKKIGPGPTPIETDEGWLLIYHGVLESCNGFVYSMGVMLLDKNEPWKIIKRGQTYLMSPRAIYECVGDVPNVTFPCAALTDAKTGRIAIYYGCADTVTGLAFTTVDELKKFLDTEYIK